MTSDFETTKPKGSNQLWGVPVTRLLGLLVTPLLIAAVFMWGLWDPPSRLDNVTAAVVNLDEPVEVDGQLTPLGRVLAAELIGTEGGSNFTWRLTDEQDAAEGLESGDYITVVTIPENFSAAATSLSKGPAEATQATIDIETSERAKLLDPALASVVTSTATRLLNDQLGEAFVGNVFVGMTELGEGVDQIHDGATELASGAGQLADGAGELSDGAGLLSDGASELVTGAYGVAAGASELADGSTQYAGGVEEYAAGVSEFSEGLGSLSEGTRELAEGASQTAEGAENLSGGAAELSDGLGEYVGGINSILTPLSELAGQVSSGLGDIQVEINAAVKDGILTKEQADEILAKLAEFEGTIEAAPVMLGGLIDAGDKLAGGASDLADGAESLAVGSSGIAEGITGVADGLGVMSEGATGLSSGADLLAEGALGLAEGSTEFAEGTEAFAGGVSALADGAGELAEGSTTLAEGTSSLADGAGELASGIGTMAGEMPRYTDQESAKFAELAIAPVKGGDSDATLFNGSGAPLFVALALWAGALASFLLLRPLWPRTRDAALSEAAITLRSVTPGVILGIAQGGLVGIGVGVVLNLSATQLLTFIFFTTVVAVAFSLMNQALVALLGGYGKFISVLILSVGFVAGIISTAPATLRAISSFTPFGTAESGFITVLDTTAGSFGAVMVMALWGALGFLLTGWAVHRLRTKTKEDI